MLPSTHRVLVRVCCEGQLLEGLSDLPAAGLSLDPQELVVILVTADRK